MMGRFIIIGRMTPAIDTQPHPLFKQTPINYPPKWQIWHFATADMRGDGVRVFLGRFAAGETEHCIISKPSFH